MPPFAILAPPSVFRALDDLSDEDYDLVAETILELATTPIPAEAKKLRVRNARIALTDGTLLTGPFLSVRCRSATGGQRGGFRIIYVVDTGAERVCTAKVAWRDEDTYKDLERLLKGGRLRALSSPLDDPNP